MKNKKLDCSAVFPVCPHEADDGKVFVESEIDTGDGVMDKWYAEKAADCLLPEDKVIPCIICGKPAVQLDHLWPNEDRDNRCEEHRDSFIDEDLYFGSGIAREVCAHHYRMLNYMRDMKSCRHTLHGQGVFMANFQKEHGEVPAWGEIEKCRREAYESIDKAMSALSRYIARRWPEEMFGPAEKPFKSCREKWTSAHGLVAGMLARLRFHKYLEDERFYIWRGNGEDGFAGSGDCVSYDSETGLYSWNERHGIEPKAMSRLLQDCVRETEKRGTELRKVLDGLFMEKRNDEYEKENAKDKKMTLTRRRTMSQSEAANCKKHSRARPQRN